MPILLAFSRPFDRAFERLTKVEQHRVDTAVMSFRRNPDLPGHRLHKLTNGLWSMSPSDELRVILHREGGRGLLLHVGHHDAAYAWAARHRLDRHEVTGEMQLVELPEVTRGLGPAAPAPAPRPGLLAGEDPAYLAALGVPGDWIGPVRAIRDSDGLLDLVGKIPDDVVERLIELAAGHRPAPPAPVAPDADPWATEAARRQFRLLADDPELQRALERPWPEWTVWLHPAQRDAVERRFEGPARVTGPAGTGKTVVTLHRAARLARARDEARVLVASFSKALAQRMAAALDLLLAAEPEVRARIRVQHLHALAAEIVRTAPRHPVALGDRDLDRRVTAARGDLPAAWTDAFLVAEWRAVIDFRGVRSLASYQAIPRQGRGRRLSAAERAAIWPVFARMREEMERKGEASWADHCELAAGILATRGETPFDHVLIDEAQDFGPRELAFAMQLAPHGRDALFLAGDGGQRIYRYPWSWSEIGLDVRGRSRRLGVNYRTSAEIRRAADALLPAAEAAGGGEAEPRAALSRFRGPPPRISACATREDEREALRGFLAGLVAEGVAPGEIAVLARTADRLEDALDAPARALGLARQPLAETAPDRLVAGTLHGAKGLEFRAVAIVGAEAGTIPLGSVLAREPDPLGRAALEAQERHLLYVGMTRARERLLVTHVGDPSHFLARQEAGK